MPNSRLEVLPSAGHFPEEPARFVEILRDFLRTTEPSKFAPKEMRERLRRGADRTLPRAPADRNVTYVFGSCLYHWMWADSDGAARSYPGCLSWTSRCGSE